MERQQIAELKPLTSGSDSGKVALNQATPAPDAKEQRELLLFEYECSRKVHGLETLWMLSEFTVYLAVAGFLLKDIACGQRLNGNELGIASGVGLILSLVFTAIHLRTSYHQRSGMTRARELESILGFSLFSRRVPSRVMGASRAISLVYYAGIIVSVVGLWVFLSQGGW